MIPNLFFISRLFSGSCYDEMGGNGGMRGGMMAEGGGGNWNHGGGNMGMMGGNTGMMGGNAGMMGGQRDQNQQWYSGNYQGKFDLFYKYVTLQSLALFFNSKATI